jgi:hypothetical protein
VSEREIQRAILLRYGTDPRMRIWRNSVGYDEGHRVKYGLPGSADILGILNGGRFLAIEVKAEKGRQSEQQVAFQRMIEAFGGLYILARSVADVEAAL